MIEGSLDLPYGYRYESQVLKGGSAPITSSEGAAHAKLLAENRTLDEDYEGQGGFPKDIDVRLGELEVGMKKQEIRPMIFDSEET